MVTKLLRLAVVGVVTTMVWPAPLWAQYPSEVVGFNGPPNDDPSTSQEMFRTPQISGTTALYILPNVNPYDNNAAFRASGLQTEGAAALEAFFKWVDPADPDGWLRLTTFNGAERPNPGLDTQGKVRFKIVNKGEITKGAIGLCLGIRETGQDVPQLQNGGTVGDIEWAGVSEDLSVIDAGTNGIIESAVAGDDVLIDTNGVQAINWGPDRVLQSVANPTSDDVAASGYVRSSATGGRVPVPAITIGVSVVPKLLEWDLSTGAVTVDGGGAVGGLAGFTGNGDLSDALNHRGTLEHLAITNVVTDAAITIDFAIDELQFEATMPDPVLPPSVVSPIVAGQEQISVTNLMYEVDEVSLYVATPPGAPVLVETKTVYSNADVVFTIGPPGAVEDDVYTATQGSDQSGTMVTSDHSLGITVLPAAPPFTFSLVMNEDGDCGTATYEWVGVTSITGSYGAQGTPVFADSAVWQTVEIPLDNDDLVWSWAGYGSGALDDCAGCLASDVYSMDTLWFTIAPDADSNGLGPWELYIDAVQMIDSVGADSDIIMDFEDGINRIQLPRYQSPVQTVDSSVSSDASYSGDASHRLIWSYDSTDPSLSLGMMQRTGWPCVVNQVQFDDTSSALRFRLLCREISTNALPLPEVVGPIVLGQGAETQDTIRVNVDSSATSVQLLIDGEDGDVISPIPGTEVDFTGQTLVAGQSISARQTLPGGISDPAYPKPVAPKSLPPTVNGPLFPGDWSVTVSDCLTAPHATAYAIWVYAGGTELIGAEYGGTETVVVPLFSRPLAPDELITAVQTVNGIDSDPSEPVIVAIPGPTIFKVPAQGDADVRVIDVLPTASLVTVSVNGGATSFSADPGGETWVNVPVSGLVAGDTVTANMTVMGNLSGESEAETVTTNVETLIICDDFESYANQAAFELAWPVRGTTLDLVGQNTTPGGSQGLYANGNEGNWKLFTPGVTPAVQVPVVWTMTYYDFEGEGGPDDRQFLQLDGSYWYGGGSGSYFLLEMGTWYDSRTHYCLRIFGSGGPGWVVLDQYDAPPRSIGWHSFSVIYKGDRIDAYVDGLLALKNVASPTGMVLEVAQLGANPYGNGQMYTDDYCVTTGPARIPVLDLPPVAPTVESPLVDGDAIVTVSGITDDADSVTVYTNGGSPVTLPLTPGAQTEADVTVAQLAHLDLVTATQHNAIGDSGVSAALEVGKGSGDVLICIGIRDANDDIEWVGASTHLNGAPQGTAISPSASWQPLSFDPTGPAVSPMIHGTGPVGDGVIDGTTGTLEHLAVAVNAASADRSTGVYNLFVDNVDNPAGVGLITDFESFALGAEVLFQEPTYSGTTYPDDLSYPPSVSQVTDAPGNPGQSAWLRWFWKDTTDQRWARITTASATNLPSPTIDLTKPISMDILLMADCGTVSGDMDDDGDVDIADYPPFEQCLLGPLTSVGPDCVCADFNGDRDVDLSDVARFQRAFGP
ncbi:MAG: hypothetical protein JSV19_13980 [Phycisphaerales bacterium]|nr:MAG: hypothetical protein JSV19_13980 [Phycisphaerales bacterium]